MEIETLSEDDHLVIRRMKLDPGEKMHWHWDNCRRFTVVVSGSKLAIEYVDDGDVDQFDVYPGLTGWDEPQSRVHRAINTGDQIYEEVVSFYRDSPEVEPQPKTDD